MLSIKIFCSFCQCNQKGGKGHWTVNRICTKVLQNLFPFVGSEPLGTFSEFDLSVQTFQLKFEYIDVLILFIFTGGLHHYIAHCLIP